MTVNRSTETVHTPGPWQWYWRVNDDLKADCGVFYERREGQAYSVCRAPQYQGQKQWEADARLISSAPDLLAACRGAVLQIEYLHDKFKATGSGGAVLHALRDAIEKAEGKRWATVTATRRTIF